MLRTLLVVLLFSLQPTVSLPCRQMLGPHLRRQPDMHCDTVSMPQLGAPLQCPDFRLCLSLADLHSLSLTCKNWQAATQACIGGLEASQLLAALSANILCVDTPPNRQQTAEVVGESTDRLSQFRKLVTSLKQSYLWYPWGPALAATPGILDDVSRIFTVPYPPNDIVKYLVQHTNTHIKYQQLRDAAYTRVAGVEIWVQAQHRLGIQTDIPAMAVSACLETEEDEDDTDFRNLVSCYGLLT